MNETNDFFPSDQEDNQEMKSPNEKYSGKETVKTYQERLLTDERNHEINSTEIYIKSSIKNEHGDRIRQKTHCCIFCHKLFND